MPGCLIEFLSDGAAFGRPDESVQRIETHAALVFLVGERAYKMKREVRYSFLDFSTLAKRKSALEAELRLNRRTAPQIYRRLVAVKRSANGMSIDGDGEAVEFLLEMTRFDQDGLLDQVAISGRLDKPLVDQLASAIVDLHRQADVSRDAGGHAAMADVIRGNAHDLRRARKILSSDADIGCLIDHTTQELNEHRQLLDRRRGEGFVRHCHGDLHLGNIVLYEGAPVLFDCLEFSEELATIDTFYDLAFLLMDLTRRGLSRCANWLLNAYLDATADDDGTALLPLFMAVRATIRGKVAAIDADLSEDDEDCAISLRDCERYVALASRLLEREKPQLIAIGGVSGTGKSTVARAVAPDLCAEPGAVIVRSDVLRKRLFHVAPDERLPDEAYDADVDARVYDAIRRRAARLLRAGCTVIIDATALDPTERASFVALAKQERVAFRGIWLTGSPRVLAERIRRRARDVSDATITVLNKQLSLKHGPIEWIAIDTMGAVEEVATRVLASLRSSRTPVAPLC